MLPGLFYKHLSHSLTDLLTQSVIICENIFKTPLLPDHESRKQKFWENVYLPPSVSCHVSHVTCHESRDEHEYLNIWIFEYFGVRINIRIRFPDKVHIWIYSNICSVLWIYSNNTECFEQTGCMSYGPKILREHSPPLVYHVSLVK